MAQTRPTPYRFAMTVGDSGPTVAKMTVAGVPVAGPTVAETHVAGPTVAETHVAGVPVAETPVAETPVARVVPAADAKAKLAAPAEDGCVFCAIVTGRAEASFVHADDTVLAFMDIAPVTPGHILVIPREHAPQLADLNEERGAQMWRVAHRVAKALRRSGLRVDGVNLFLADGEAAFQEVFHAHLHVFPRYPGDGFRVQTDGRKRERAELDADAALVGRALAHL